MPVVNFDPALANHVPPEDVLPVINFFPPEGGPRACDSNSINQPTLDTTPEPAEWLSEVAILTCGWQPNEQITVTVMHEGSIYANEVQPSNYSITYILPISTSMEVGDYSIVLEAPSGRAETSVNIYRPSGPRLYHVGENELVLYGFAPNEAVRLFAYERESTASHHLKRLIGWSRFQVDPSGMLIVNAPEDLTYYIVGDISGMVQANAMTSAPVARPILVAPCGGRSSYLEHIYPGPGPRVNASVEAPMDLRSAAGFSNAVVSHVEQGTLVAIVSGPTCIENNAWWFIRTENEQQSGWVPEYQNEVYLLKPYPKDTLSPIAKTLPEIQFDLTTANQVPPEDVFSEVGFFGQGAGNCGGLPAPDPMIFLAPYEAELLEQRTLSTCGWEKDEVLKGTIRYPDGRTLTQYVKVESSGDNYSAKLDFTPTLEDPLGIYTYTLQGQRGTLTATAEFHLPDGPRIYMIDPFHVLLYHFAPQESVRLICYGQDNILQAWQDITVDVSGNQSVRIETDQCALVALGQTSGEIHQMRPMLSTVKKTCGGLMTRLEESVNARVAFIDGTDKPVRRLEGYSQEVVTSIPEGTILHSLGGPRCADGSLWWSVRTDDKTLGWMPEEQNGVYLLEPAP
jgi:hypothetical protein